MLRLKMPAGVCPPELYTLLDDLSREYGHGHLRLTTRQTFQLHGVAKHNLKTVIKVRLDGWLVGWLAGLSAWCAFLVSAKRQKKACSFLRFRLYRGWSSARARVANVLKFVDLTADAVKTYFHEKIIAHKKHI